MLPALHRSLLRSCMQPANSVVRSHSRTASTKAQLPRLPVPDLHQTLQKYLRSLEPFFLEDEARGGPTFESALALRTRWASDFETGLGAVCQSRLQELDRTSPNNWLDDNIWLKKAYHEWRAPVLVNSNWWLSFKNDPNLPQEIIRGSSLATIGETGINLWQIRRAAWLTHRVLEFKEQLQRQSVYPDSTKTGIWFRNSIDRIFNTSRVAKTHCDTFSAVPPPSEQFARSILVSVHDWLYTLEVVNTRQQVITAHELETRIRGVVLDVKQRLASGEVAVPISVLSADHRDKWAENLHHLLRLSPQNCETFDAINHSIIALSLDHYTYVLPTSTSPTWPLPNSSEEVDAHLHNLRSSRTSAPAHNRWHDKPFTLIVESNTRAGAIGEHSPVDALVPSILAEYAVVQSVDDDAFSGAVDTSQTLSGNIHGWRRLDWVVDDHIRQACVDAEDRAREIASDSDDSALWFEDYGTDWMKNDAGLSPDAFIQMALQLAWYRQQGFFTATYETALTRLFHNGRTETIRTFTSDSRAWVLAMDDPNVSTTTRYRLLQAAIKTHSGLTRAAATGKGIDRHLLGLRCMLKPGESHDLFDDEHFVRSQTWKLSTSGLSAGHQFRGTGFGSSEHDGYGINYLAGPDYIKFGIESKHACQTTSTQGLKTTLTAALQDMYRLCSTAASHRL